MPSGKVKWFSLEKGFGFIASDEGEDVYLAASALPAGVTTVKPGTKLEFGVADGRRGPQALSVKIIEPPASMVAANRMAPDDLAAIIEDAIKILDRIGNGLPAGPSFAATDPDDRVCPPNSGGLSGLEPLRCRSEGGTRHVNEKASHKARPSKLCGYHV